MKISDLDASKSAELKESRSKAEKFLKEAERNARKEAMAKKKREKESKELTDLIRSRGIQIVTHKVLVPIRRHGSINWHTSFI